MLSLLRRNRVEKAETLLTDLVDQLSTQCFSNDDQKKKSIITKQQRKDDKKDERKIPEERTTTGTVGEIFASANMHKVSVSLITNKELFKSLCL